MLFGPDSDILDIHAPFIPPKVDDTEYKWEAIERVDVELTDMWKAFDKNRPDPNADTDMPDDLVT